MISELEKIRSVGQRHIKPTVYLYCAHYQPEAIPWRRSLPNADRHSASRPQYATDFRQSTVRFWQVDDTKAANRSIKGIVRIRQLLRIALTALSHWRVPAGRSDHGFREVNGRYLRS